MKSNLRYIATEIQNHPEIALIGNAFLFYRDAVIHGVN